MTTRIRSTGDQLSFHSYLVNLYPDDLRSVALGVRRRHRTLHLEPDNGIVLQPMHLTSSNWTLERMNPTQHDSFAIGLAWQIWFDEAVWTWYRDWYAEFRERTLFPKLVGDCPGGCRSHLSPIEALRLTGAGREGPTLEMRFRRSALLMWSIPVIESFVQDLSREMPLLPGIFERGLVEFRLCRPEHRIPQDDLVLPAPIRGWRMPTITERELRDRMKKGPGHGVGGVVKGIREAGGRPPAWRHERREPAPRLLSNCARWQSDR